MFQLLWQSLNSDILYIAATLASAMQEKNEGPTLTGLRIITLRYIEEII
jgi:hypothetical protein